MKTNIQKMIAEVERPKTLAGALVMAQSLMHHATIDAVNPHFRSRYATLQAVIDAVKPALNAAGIAFYQKTEPAPGGVVVETVFLHESGETLSTGALFVPAGAQSAHGYGSALTYAKRYSLAMACGIGADEDDDGNVATANPPTQTQTVTEQQAEEIKALIAQTSSDTLAFLKALGNAPSVDELPSAAYSRAVALLKKKAARNAS